jgi:hypothetical protein
MDWKVSLDRYLTTPPDDGFTDYFENVSESLSNDFWDENEDWVLDSKEFENWVSKCFDKGKHPKTTARIIERLHRIKLYYEKLISQAHTNLTIKKGKKEYAPTIVEIQNEINKIKTLKKSI